MARLADRKGEATTLFNSALAEKRPNRAEGALRICELIEHLKAAGMRARLALWGGEVSPPLIGFLPGWKGRAFHPPPASTATPQAAIPSRSAHRESRPFP